MLLEGIVGGRYKIIKMVGKGGSGEVYLAEDQKLFKQWAVKVIRKCEVYSYLCIEAQVLIKLEHPALPRVIDIWEEGEYFCIVMDYIRGETLQKKIEQGNLLIASNAAKWGMIIADALFYLHNCIPPIYYGDLKPANIIITEEGQVKLVDFGSARRGFEKQTDQLTGTMGFAAPEQYLGNIDERSDIYAFGQVLTVMFQGIENIKKYKDSRRENQLLKKMIEKCTAVSPQNRYQSMKEVIEVLDVYERKSSIRLMWEKRMKTLVVYMFSILSVLCVAGGLTATYMTEQHNRNLYNTYIREGDVYQMEYHISEAAKMYMKAINEVNRNRREGYERILTLYMSHKEVEQGLSWIDGTIPKKGYQLQNRQQLLYKIGRAYFYPCRNYEKALGYFKLVSENKIPEVFYYKQICRLLIENRTESERIDSVLEEFLDYNKQYCSGLGQVVNAECVADIYLTYIGKKNMYAKKAKNVIEEGIKCLEQLILQETEWIHTEELINMQLSHYRKAFTLYKYLWDTEKLNEYSRKFEEYGWLIIELTQDGAAEESKLRNMIFLRLAEEYENRTDYAAALECYELGENEGDTENKELWFGHICLLLKLYQETGEEEFKNKFLLLSDVMKKNKQIQYTSRFERIQKQIEELTLCK